VWAAGKRARWPTGVEGGTPSGTSWATRLRAGAGRLGWRCWWAPRREVARRARKPTAGAGPLARGRPRGLSEIFSFIIFLPFLFLFPAINLFTITSYILNGYTPKQNITQKQIYFRMMHQSLFP
jgi:hypothetical protein